MNIYKIKEKRGHIKYVVAETFDRAVTLFYKKFDNNWEIKSIKLFVENVPVDFE